MLSGSPNGVKVLGGFIGSDCLGSYVGVLGVFVDEFWKALE